MRKSTKQEVEERRSDQSFRNDDLSSEDPTVTSHNEREREAQGKEGVFFFFSFGPFVILFFNRKIQGNFRFSTS